MRKILATGLLLTCMYSWSQDVDKVDSLIKLLDKTFDARTSVNILNELAFEYVNLDSAKAHTYAAQAFSLADSIGYEIGMVSANMHLGWTIFRSGHYDQAIEAFQKALIQSKEFKYAQGEAEAHHGIGTVLCDKGEFDAARETLDKALEINLAIDHKKGIAVTYNQLGILSAYRGDYRSTLDYFLKALALQLELDDPEKIAGNYNNIAIVYEELNEEEKALSFYEKALELNDQLDNRRGLAINYTNISSIYQNLGKYEEGFDYAQKALEMNKEINHIRGVSLSLSILANFYQEKGELTEALAYFEQSLTISQELGDPSRIASTKRQMGETLIQLKRVKEALELLLEAEESSLEIGNADIYQATLGSLSRAYEASGDYKNAYLKQVQFKEMSDSLLNDENNEQIARLEAEFEFNQERDSLAFARAGERAAFEADIKARKNTQSITYIGLIVLFLSAAVIAYLYRFKQQANTKLVQLNQEISQQRDNLKKVNRTKTRLFSIIAHDIRGPMSVFIGFSDILIEHIQSNYKANQDTELDKIRNHLRQASGRLLELMDDMVSWAQKEEGVVPYHPSILDVRKLIEETRKVVEPLASAKSISLKIEVEDGTTLWADKNSCKTILRNLVSNAIKFTPEDGTVTISTGDSNGKARISVSDTGIGIPQDKMNELFEINKSKVRKGTNGEKGTGLGLNVVQEFVEMNKGSISVESEVARGTTFTISLPGAELVS